MSTGFSAKEIADPADHATMRARLPQPLLLVKKPLLFAAVAVLLPLTSLRAAEPTFQIDFEKAELGKLPAEAMVLAGEFAVREEGGNKFLELPGAPLESFGLLIGPSQPGEASITARFFGTKQGRKSPAYALSLGGVGGYRLELSGGKKTLEIFKGDESRKSAAFEFPSGAWTRLRLQLRKTAAGSVIEGKAWPDGQPEPAEWNITLEEATPPPAGRAALWGTPYSGTPIRYDDVRIEAPRAK